MHHGPPMAWNATPSNAPTCSSLCGDEDARWPIPLLLASPQFHEGPLHHCGAIGSGADLPLDRDCFLQAFDGGIEFLLLVEH
jgi:hypothetical protein